MRPWEFWQLTFAEYVDMAKGFRRKQIARANELLYLAWHTEYFHRCERMPRFEEIMRDPEETPRTKEQTPEDMMAIAKLWTAALGGEVVEVCDPPEE